MATQTAPATAPPAAIWEDFIDIFYAPSSVFRRRENGSFFVPLAVVTVLCAALFYLNSGVLQPVFDAEFDRGMATAMRQNPNIPPEAAKKLNSKDLRLFDVFTGSVTECCSFSQLRIFVSACEPAILPAPG